MANYPKNCWYVAAWVHELEGGAMLARTIANLPIVFYRKGDKELVALADRCPHRAAPLSMGKIEGYQLRCGYHGFRFDAAGICTEIPGQAKVPAAVCVARYATISRYGWIWVWLGDADLADASLIPVVTALDDPQWTMRSGQVEYRAYYELINDNLTDLSHLSYVHTGSFGSSEDWARIVPKIETLERGVRITRWLPGNEVTGAGGAADVWSATEYSAPGILSLRTTMYPAGTAAACLGAQPGDDIVPIFDSRSSQAVTPITDTSSRYLFGAGVAAGEGSDGMADMGLVIATKAFEEDRLMIEAQQRSIDLTGETMMLVGSDLAPGKFRAIMAKLSQQES